MSQIETALFTLSLDDHTLPSTSIIRDVDPQSTIIKTELDGHVRNTASSPDGTNRWFDKALSLIVESNSRFGVMGEHSPVDALIPSIMVDWANSEPIDMSMFPRDTPWRMTLQGEPGWTRLKWVIDDQLDTQCQAATMRAKEIIDDSDAAVLWFNDYGVDWIKNEGKSSL